MQIIIIGTGIFLLFIFVLVFLLFLIKRHYGKKLEELVKQRTAEINSQHTLMRVVNNAAVLLLESDAEHYLDPLIRSMEMICRQMETDRVYLWQNERKDDGKLY